MNLLRGLTSVAGENTQQRPTRGRPTMVENKSLCCYNEAINASNPLVCVFLLFQAGGCDSELIKDWFCSSIHENWKTLDSLDKDWRLR
jgi:hypothetical protein